jgi:hypothetical protein
MDGPGSATAAALVFCYCHDGSATAGALLLLYMSIVLLVFSLLVRLWALLTMLMLAIVSWWSRSHPFHYHNV